MKAPIPVYISRHGELPEGYGAFINWQVGEQVTIISASSKPPRKGIVKSKMLWHNYAPEVDSARGRGQWVYEVEIEGEMYTPSPWQLVLP